MSITTAKARKPRMSTTQYWAKVAGLPCGSVELVEDLRWTEDADTYRYTVAVDGDEDGTDDLAEARVMVAGRLRDLRAERMEEIADEAREAVETLLDGGKGHAVLKALKAAGLI
jgi:hypothetical protein